MFGPLGAQEVHPLRRIRQGNSADMVQSTRLLRDLLQFSIELNGIPLQGRHVGVGVQGMDATSRVPGRTRGQLGAFD